MTTTSSSMNDSAAPLTTASAAPTQSPAGTQGVDHTVAPSSSSTMVPSTQTTDTILSTPAGTTSASGSGGDVWSGTPDLGKVFALISFLRISFILLSAQY
jgi:hypothetical protein